jgi:hypothetical protein
MNPEQKKDERRSTPWDNGQREQLQIEPTNSFGFVGIQAVSLDAMLSEFATASTQLAFAEVGQRNAPVAVRRSTAYGLG